MLRNICGLIVLFVLSSLASCDPVHHVYLINNTTDTATITAMTTVYYDRADSILSYEVLNDSVRGFTRVRFKIAPGDTIKCGQTIAEIDDEIPFQAIHIHWKQDSLTANSETEVKELFDKSAFGKLKTPYTITIK
jgi:hypothetical protein